MSLLNMRKMSVDEPDLKFCDFFFRHLLTLTIDVQVTPLGSKWKLFMTLFSIYFQLKLQSSKRKLLVDQKQKTQGEVKPPASNSVHRADTQVLPWIPPASPL